MQWSAAAHCFVPDLELVDGQAASLSAAMTAARIDSLLWGYGGTDYAAAALGLNPASSTNPPFVSVALRASPWPVALLSDGFFPLVEFSAVMPGSPSASVGFVNPFPASWDAVADVRYQVVVERALGAAAPKLFSVELRTVVPRASIASTPARPLLGGVRAAQVNGLDLLAAHSGIGLRPTFSWQPPSLGTPTRYALVIERLVAESGKTVVAETVRPDTPDTRVTLPPGVLRAGADYVVTVVAYETPSPGDPDLFDQSLPWVESSIVSGVLRP